MHFILALIGLCVIIKIIYDLVTGKDAKIAAADAEVRRRIAAAAAERAKVAPASEIEEDDPFSPSFRVMGGIFFLNDPQIDPLTKQLSKIIFEQDLIFGVMFARIRSNISKKDRSVIVHQLIFKIRVRRTASQGIGYYHFDYVSDNSAREYQCDSKTGKKEQEVWMVNNESVYFDIYTHVIYITDEIFSNYSNSVQFRALYEGQALFVELPIAYIEAQRSALSKLQSSLQH